MPKPKPPAPPMTRFINLSDLTQTGSRIDVTAGPEELEMLTNWADVVAVKAFGAKVDVRKLSPTQFHLAAELSADIEQRCVATLEPVFSHIDWIFARELHYLRHPPGEGGELTLAAGDDETPDEIYDLHYDLAAPLLEELSLAIDPYPRKADATFEPPAVAGPVEQGPFAALKSLKKDG
jgi:hypothetical protein